jgi:HD-GYP domain-containing protein (c-di-GMP phosphodiesterase class II)
VADAYDAMTTNRPYRLSMSHHEAISELQKNGGAQFDPQVVDAFIRSF